MRREELAALGALALGLTPFAMAYGIAAAAVGLSPTTTILTSVLIYAGASQFGAIGVLAAGGSPLLALFTVWMINVRFIPVGLAMPRAIATTWPRRLVAAHLLIDPSLALAHATAPERRARLYWVSSTAIYVLWIGGTAIGVVAGRTIPDPSLLGLDAALPCAFLAILSTWRHQVSARRAAAGGALLTGTVLAMGLPTLAIPAGVLGAALGHPRLLPTPSTTSQDAGASDAEPSDGRSGDPETGGPG